MTNKSLLTTPLKMMSSNEIARVTGVDKGQIHADIKKMLVQLELVSLVITDDMRLDRIPNEDFLSAMDDGNYHHQQFQVVTDSRGYIDYFLLNKELSITLVSGYDIKMRHAIIQRWQELEFQEKRVMPPEFPDTKAMAITLENYAKMCDVLGITGNARAIAADAAVFKQFGISPLREMGLHHIIADQNRQLLTVTELASSLGILVKETNPLLSNLGLQVRRRDYKGRLFYELTREGREYGVYIDTEKTRSDGTPIRQVKWYSSVIAYIHDNSSEPA